MDVKASHRKGDNKSSTDPVTINRDIRLCLKRINVESELNKSGSSESNKKDKLGKNTVKDEVQEDCTISDKTATNEDDSMVDFKSPKLKRVMNKQQKKKSVPTKFKLHVNNRKEVKQRKQNKRNSDAAQPVIESSFFKPKTDTADKDCISNITTALVCPLCLKTCKNSDTQILHMKTCAVKNNISTTKLLDAIELQKRQADERQALGLLAAPTVQDKKKPVERKLSVYEQSDLQLALALSKSLQEAEELHENDQINRLDDVPNIQLEKFGFATKKPVLGTKSRKRKLSRETVLQTRSDKERNHILTERIAQILMGNDTVTQKSQEDVYNQRRKRTVILRNNFLQRLQCTGERLWDKARLRPSRKCFYVSTLSEYITPQEEKIEDNHESAIEPAEICEVNNRESDQSKIGVSIDHKPFCEMTEMDCLNFSNEENEDWKSNQFIHTLLTDWRNILNDSSMSDLIIFANNDKHIWVHKLVFYVRCPNILLDVTHNDNTTFAPVKENICWPTVSYNIALAFLEFIYCGSIKTYMNAFTDPLAFTDLRNLARKYKVKELFSYLRKEKMADKQAKITENDDNLKSNKNNEIKEMKSSQLEDANNLAILSDVTCDIIITNDRNNIKTPVKKSICSQEEEIDFHEEDTRENEADYASNASSIRHNNTSPDLFDDSDVMMMNDPGRCVSQIANIKELEESDNTEMLKLINEECFLSPVNSLSTKARIDEPRSSKMERSKARCSDRKKLKSNLSLFIERVQRENARVDFDSDSDDSTLPAYTKQNRNPFNLNQLDDSDRYSTPCNSSTVRKTPGREPRGLDRFEQNLTTFQLNKNHSQEDITTIKNQTDDLNSEQVVNLTPSSDKSIEESLKKYFENSMECVSSPEESFRNPAHLTSPLSKSVTVRNECSSEESLQHVATIITSPQLSLKNGNIEISDVDTDENEISMYSKYKKSCRKNSIAKYRDMIVKSDLRSLLGDKSLKDDKTVKESEDNQDVNVLSDVNSDISDTATIPVEENCSQVKVKDSDCSIRKSVNESRYKDIEDEINSIHSECADDDDVHILGKNTFIHSPSSRDTEIVINDISHHHSQIIAAYAFDEQETISEMLQTTSSHKLTKSKSSSNITLKEVNDDFHLTQITREENTLVELKSPISLSSSPELNLDSSDTEILSENKADDAVSNRNEIHSDNDDIFDRDIYLANVRMENTFKTDAFPSFNKSVSFDNAIINKKVTTGVGSNRNPDSHTATDNCAVEQLKSKENCINRESSVRKLKKKSLSEGNFIGKKASPNKPSKCSDTSKKSKRKCYCKNIPEKSSPIIIRDNVTPPPDYDGMKTPELHKELTKYGLKLQKRNRAVKLLTYIYNELHPLVPESEGIESAIAIVSSEDEEPPSKKVNRSQNDIHDENDIDNCRYELPLSQDSNVSIRPPVSIIPEEMYSDDLKSTNKLDNTSDIKENLMKFIKVNKEIHNKILMYEPLCIESLHSMLKTGGLKCKMSTLMGFLNEQCITYYSQEKSGRSRVKKK